MDPNISITMRPITIETSAKRAKLEELDRFASNYKTNVVPAPINAISNKGTAIAIAAKNWKRAATPSTTFASIDTHSDRSALAAHASISSNEPPIVPPSFKIAIPKSTNRTTLDVVNNKRVDRTYNALYTNDWLIAPVRPHLSDTQCIYESAASTSATNDSDNAHERTFALTKHHGSTALNSPTSSLPDSTISKTLTPISARSNIILPMHISFADEDVSAAETADSIALPRASLNVRTLRTGIVTTTAPAPRSRKRTRSVDEVTALQEAEREVGAYTSIVIDENTKRNVHIDVQPRKFTLYHTTLDWTRKITCTPRERQVQLDLAREWRRAWLQLETFAGTHPTFMSKAFKLRMRDFLQQCRTLCWYVSWHPALFLYLEWLPDTLRQLSANLTREHNAHHTSNSDVFCVERMQIDPQLHSNASDPSVARITEGTALRHLFLSERANTLQSWRVWNHCMHDAANELPYAAFDSTLVRSNRKKRVKLKPRVTFALPNTPIQSASPTGASESKCVSMVTFSDDRDNVPTDHHDARNRTSNIELNSDLLDVTTTNDMNTMPDFESNYAMHTTLAEDAALRTRINTDSDEHAEDESDDVSESSDDVQEEETSRAILESETRPTDKRYLAHFAREFFWPIDRFVKDHCRTHSSKLDSVLDYVHYECANAAVLSRDVLLLEFFKCYAQYQWTPRAASQPLTPTSDASNSAISEINAVYGVFTHQMELTTRLNDTRLHRPDNKLRGCWLIALDCVSPAFFENVEFDCILLLDSHIPSQYKTHPWTREITWHSCTIQAPLDQLLFQSTHSLDYDKLAHFFDPIRDQL